MMAEVVVGLVFGVIPILVSAAEHYESVLRPFSRYKRFAPELQSFQSELQLCKSVFRNECTALLGSVTDSKTAYDILQEENHPLRSDRNLDKKLSEQLGASRDACVSVIGLIQKKLQLIEEENQGFSKVAPNSLGINARHPRQCLERVKFSISGPHLKDCLRELHRLNNLFLILSSQTTRLLDQKEAIAPWSRPAESASDVKRYQSINTSVSHLLKALNEACVTHSQHEAYFRIDSLASTSENSMIRFNLAYIPTSAELLWVRIDSEFFDEQTNSSSGSPQSFPAMGMGTELNQENYSPRERKSKRFKRSKRTVAPTHLAPVAPLRRTRFQTAIMDASWNDDPNASFQVTGYQSNKSQFISSTPLMTAKSGPSIRLPQAQTVEDIVLPDFSKHHNLCTHLQRSSKQGLNNPETLIGYLGKDFHEHRVYFIPRHPTRFQSCISLAQVIENISQNHGSPRLLMFEILKIARELACFVLQLHTTQLLNGDWRSKDVMFPELEQAEHLKRPRLVEPHLHIRIESQDAHPQAPHRLCVAPQSAIRNQYTYGLGVILLELAQQAPLRALQRSVDLSDIKDEGDIEYYLAHRLNTTLSSDLGIPYKRIVQKCLDCDFGSGSDLRRNHLQTAFHRDVILKLEELETKFATLQLDI